MYNIRTNFDKILKVLKDIFGEGVNDKGNYFRRGTVPKFSDIEVIALSFTAECLGIDSENLLFVKLNNEYLADFQILLAEGNTMTEESCSLKKPKKPES